MLLAEGVKVTVGVGYPFTTQSTWNVPSGSNLKVGPSTATTGTEKRIIDSYSTAYHY
jgi:hypothetical protein